MDPNIEIGNPQLAWLLLFIPLLLTLSIYNGWARRRALSRFGSKASGLGVVGGIFSASLLAAGIGLLVLACMDIRWGKTTREVPQKGLEVVFALDVSRSMLAEDAKPNRLTRAKQQIKDMVGEMVGDRIGLVTFAGEAIQSVPLTNHYDDFRQKLDEVGPHSVSKGGSQLGVAIKSAADAFISKTNEHRTIVLLTDGEDPESQPLELAKALHAENGLRIFTVGLGDAAQGSRIPDDNARSRQYVEHDGQQVWSKLNGSILSAIATETKAAYIPAGTKRVNMADVYHNYIAVVEKSEFETAKINAYVPRFQWFAFPAFVCLFLNVWMSARKTKRDRREQQAGKKRISGQPVRTATTKRSSIIRPSKVAAVALVLMPASVFAQSPKQASEQQTVASRINAANELVRNNESEKAIAAFGQIEVSDDSTFQDELNYNLASAHYRNSDFDAAKTLFEETARSSNTGIASDSRYNLGNCHYAKALSAAEQQQETAIAELEQAISHYRSSLRLNRQRSDARENIERARKLIEQLKNRQQDQQQQDQQQQEDQQQEDQQNESENDQRDSKDQQKENQSQQDQQGQKQDQNQNESSDSNGGGKDQSSESQSQDPNESQEGNSKNQSAQGEQGDKEKSNPDSSNPSDDNSESDPQDSQSDNAESDKANAKSTENSNSTSDDTDKGQQNRNANRKDPQTEQPQTAPDQQPGDGKEPPKGNITSANEQKDSDGDPTGSGNMANNDEQDNGMMSRQEALKLLQAVRDRDMLRRLRQQRQQRQRRIKVDKDW